MRRRIIVFAATAAMLLIPAARGAAACHAFSFDQASYSAGEGAGSVTITVSRDGFVQDSSIQFNTVDGSAKSGSDYSSRSGTLEYTGQQLEKQIVVPILNDTKDEPNEGFTVRLHTPGGCGSSFDDPVTVTITDNDPKPQPTTSSTPTRSSSPRATTSASPRPTQSAPRTASASPSPTPSASPTASPTPTQTTIAVADEVDGGLSGGTVGAIVAAAVVLGGAAIVVVRRRFLT